MKRLSIPLRMLFVLLAVLLLAACAPEEQQQPPSAEEIQAAVETSVAQTVEAQEEMAASVEATVEAREAVNAEAAAESLPTATEVPPTAMPTLTPVLATATPLVVTSGGSGGTSGGGGGTSQYPYSCDVIRQRPQDNTEFKRTHTFDVTFAILNNGTSTWEAGKDLTLLNDHGVLVTPFTTLQLPEMKPGDVFVLPVYDAMAPDEPGHYVIDFKLEGGFCYPYVAFNVVR